MIFFISISPLALTGLSFVDVVVITCAMIGVTNAGAMPTSKKWQKIIKTGYFNLFLAVLNLFYYFNVNIIPII